MVRFKLPVGTALGVTNAKIKQVEEYLLARPDVSGIFSAVGGFGGDAVNQGMAYTILKDRKERQLSQSDIIKVVRTDIKKNDSRDGKRRFRIFRSGALPLPGGFQWNSSFRGRTGTLSPRSPKTSWTR